MQGYSLGNGAVFGLRSINFFHSESNNINLEVGPFLVYDLVNCFSLKKQGYSLGNGASFGLRSIK